MGCRRGGRHRLRETVGFTRERSLVLSEVGEGGRGEDTRTPMSSLHRRYHRVMDLINLRMPFSILSSAKVNEG